MKFEVLRALKSKNNMALSNGDDQGQIEQQQDDEQSPTFTNASPTSQNKKELKIMEGKIYLVKRADSNLHPGEIIQLSKDKVKLEYYVHYVGLDRRLDEWVTLDRIITETTTALNDNNGSLNRDKLGTIEYLADGDRKLTRNQKRRIDEISHVPNPDEEIDSSEKEHRHLTKVKYIKKLRLGRFEIDTWYVSPYPKEYNKVNYLYVCEYCLKYMRYRETYLSHTVECTRRQPPGEIIYSKDKVSIFKIDGEHHKLYCQLLCLLAKLFIDQKSLLFDIASFFFYVMCEMEGENAHVVGYFSKEKESLDQNNVACILILPPYQRKGYGKLLIAFSYELSRIEGIIGSPEKPLSDLGRISYRSYWAYTLLKLMKESRSNMLSIPELIKLSCITQEDIIYTLESMKMVKYWKDRHIICVSKKTVDEYLQLPQFKKPKITIDPDGFNKSVLEKMNVERETMKQIFG